LKYIGLLGFGTVGSGVYEILNNRSEELALALGEPVAVKKILVMPADLERKKAEGFDVSLLTTRFEDILEDPDIDVIVEVTGAFEDGLRYMRSSLEKGIPVVTANKSVVSAHMESLLTLAKEKETPFLYEAAVGGAIPILKPLKEEILLNRIDEIEGILNGTANYILTRMFEEGLDYDKVLKKAQELGYAEFDPTDDVEGFDSMRKLRILATLAFRGAVSEDDVIVSGISSITQADIDYIKSENAVVKLLGRAVRTGDTYTAVVEPIIVDRSDSFASVSMALNSIAIRGDHVGELRFYGEGAGKLPTADAILRDVIDILLGAARWRNDIGDEKLSNANDTQTGRYYLRVTTDAETLEAIRARSADFAVAPYWELTKDGSLIVVFGEAKRSDVYALVGEIELKREDFFIARVGYR
jgi:homoserine dehydrogenase